MDVERETAAFYRVVMCKMTSDTRSERNRNHHADTVEMGRRAGIPNPLDLERAAKVLNEGKRVAILAGRGALGAGEELERLAEAVGGPVIIALLGKACLPDDSPYTTGGIGLLGTQPSHTAIDNCDTLFLVGSSFPYMEFYPKPGQARAVQLDRDPSRIGLRYPVEVELVGDCVLVQPELEFAVAVEGDNGWCGIDSLGTVAPDSHDGVGIVWAVCRASRRRSRASSSLRSRSAWMASRRPARTSCGVT